METEHSIVQTLGGMTLTSQSTFAITDEELKNFYLKELKKNMDAFNKFNAHVWDKGMMEIQTENMYYLTHENISPKERVRINNCVSEHLMFLTQMATNSQTMKHMFEVYSRHYKNVSRLLKQYNQKIPKEG